MKKPLILISPSTQSKGVEFSDASISLSNRYPQAVVDAGGLPLILPCITSPELIAEYVSRCDGVMLTGGDDIQPNIYAPDLEENLAKLVRGVEPERDMLEMLVVDEVFKQHKPLLAICRGHQLLNVALGGTLIVDIPTQLRNSLQHRQMSRKMEAVHDVEIATGSFFETVMNLGKIGVNSTHHQAIDKVAGALQVAGKSEDGIIEVLELKDKAMLPFLLSLQFHPERLYDRYPEFQRVFKSFIQASSK